MSGDHSAVTLFDRVALIGLGQMGASLGLAIKAGARTGTLAGYDLHPDHSATALSIEAIDTLAASAEEAVAGADLIILCTPVGTYRAIMHTIKAHLKAGAVVTDIGSIKAQAARDILAELPEGVHYVPSHPVAGSEKTGPYTARADYFVNHLFLITPVDERFNPAVEPVAQLWQSTGAHVDVLTLDAHDKIYAYMSHLPQLMCYAAMPVLDAQGIRHDGEDPFFARFIRIGRSDPEMWRDVFVENSENVLGAAGAVANVLAHIRDELRGGAPAEEPSPHAAPDIPLQNLLLKAAWPRILASALIMTVQAVEEQSGSKLARFAAGGFTDFTCPVQDDAEAHVELLSNHAAVAASLIDDYLMQMQRIIDYLSACDKSHLIAQLAVCQACGKRLIATHH